MPEAPPLTRELAVRIERLVALGAFGHPKNSDNPDAAQVAHFGNAIAVKAKTGRPQNMVLCFGHEDLKHLDDILASYAADNFEPTFYLAPMGFSKQMAAALAAAGFGQQEFEQAILYGVPPIAPASLPDNVTIERVTSENLDEFVTVTADGFEWPSAWRDAAMAGVRNSFGEADWHRFLAYFGGEPAGVGSLTTRDGVASLVDDAVIARFRGKGLQSALIHHRLYAASELGCDFVLGAANFGSSSFQNQQRAGLRLAYVESAWKRFGRSA